MASAFHQLAVKSQMEKWLPRFEPFLTTADVTIKTGKRGMCWTMHVTIASYF